jgi:acyl-coenzyme A synthetase/AMP-(fatty) acid ligase
MGKIFFVDRYNHIEKSYEDLLNDINNTCSFNSTLYSKSTYEVMKNIILSLILDEPIVLLDGDFSEEEIKNIGIESSSLNSDTNIEKDIFHNIIELYNSIKRVKNWSLTLFTSGTTGRPKTVVHTFDTLTKTMKVDERYKDNVWGFAYNITHFAGLQVFFQGFLNENTFVDIFGENMFSIDSLINEYKINSISSTPTYFRNVVGLINGKKESLRVITMGGEKFDKQVADRLVEQNPNLRVRNIYASTEAGSLFTSKNGSFYIPEKLKGLIKVSAESELLVHESVLGKIDDKLIVDSWYNTGDIVEIIDGEIIFKSRKSEMINIGGYKVNPNEVEELIRSIDGVSDVLVKGRKNRITGEIVACEVEINEDVDEKEIKSLINKVCSENLQKWKVPRSIKIVEGIEKTRTGKKVRK